MKHNDHNLPGHFELDDQGRPTRWVSEYVKPRSDIDWSVLIPIVLIIVTAIVAGSLDGWAGVR